MQFNISLKENIVEEIRTLKRSTETETQYIRRVLMERLEKEFKERERLIKMEEEWRG